MSKLSTQRKKIAISLLGIWVINLLLPSASYALTSGPAQPETKGFQVAGVADMVDLQSGGLKYNIPLLDIDGYPLNLSYQSGVGMDDEASWVGLGWSLNPGAINRQLRGVPDDFSGDQIETDHYVKPKVTVGGRLTAKAEAFGIAHLNGSFTFGVFSDNYTGLGAELGVNAGISYAMANDGFLTAGLGAGVLSNTQSGVDASVSPYVSLAIKEHTDRNSFGRAGLSGSFGYNSRSGLKSLTLGESFGVGTKEKNGAGETTKAGEANYSVSGSTINYNTEPISPSVQIPFTSDYSSYSFDVGGEVFGFFGSIGGTGYKNVRQVKNTVNYKPAFGFLYAERGKDNLDAQMDFIRDNDNPVIPTLPNLALPIHTPDIWSYTSQSGSGQFRLYRGGSGAFFDNQATDGSTVSTIGGDLGLGAWVHGGVTLYNQHAATSTHKWTNNNGYLINGDFQKPDYTNPKAEHVYFRQVGEKNVEDEDMATEVSGTQALAIATSGVTALSKFRNAGNLNGVPAIDVNSPIRKTNRRPNRTVISYLTAAEAAQAGLYKNIRYYGFKDSTSYASLTANPTYDSLDRVDPDIRKPHHISEIMVTDDGGKKMVYGVPVYNFSQDEYTFAIDPATRDGNNLVSVPSGITSPNGDPNGIDHYYHREHKPAYAASYLLSAVLSPDYVDRTGNGITNDDLGTAIKFNYSKLPYAYKWRTPFNKATPNRGLLADQDDDKGSIIYGEKEIWYVQSIESKTKIAYFITQDRRDALGVEGWQYGGRDTDNKQKYLKEIRLYSKADMTRPIKVVKFQYDYELCRDIPNSADTGSSDTTLAGKLTLKRVWFEYGNSDKGKYHPYTFTYQKQAADNSIISYSYQSTDRWGIYKSASENTNGLNNELFPYADPEKATRDINCALWHLSQINLPTGGIIRINYESSDYAYVQDKKAMAMTGIQSLINSSATSIDTSRALNKNITGIRLAIATAPPSGVDQTAWFKTNYLNGSDYIYAKLCINMQTSNYPHFNPIPYDFVPTYCQIKSVSISAGIAYITFVPVTEGSVTMNPLCLSAWQRLKNEYPRYAYPGFDNRIKENTNSTLAAVTAIVNAAKNLTELKQSFYQKADARGYASHVVLSHSFVKLANSSGYKPGGQARVKKILIEDTWKTSDSENANAVYGQAYSYTTMENGHVISSGVAAYEPSVGNDENALKQPVPYIQKIKGSINNYFDLELPFGESLYPAPTITYSKVTVTDLGKDHEPTDETGSIVNEFYTAKDFPVKVTALPIASFNPRPSSRYSLVGSNSDDELCLSQGYSIELNDMPGKTKATTVLDKSGAVISSTAYYYQAQDNGGSLSLNNKVDVIDPATLLVTSKVLGRDVDFFTDFREQETNNKGEAVNIGGDVFPIAFFIPFFALPHFPVGENNDYKLFRSACAVKVIQNYGILSKVVKTENGSSITTENLAYDALTGEALVTRTKNEFKKDIYSTNIPAYWAYQGMGAAYQNLGIMLSDFTTDTNGEINPGYSSYLHGGDEIVDTNNGNHYWVIDNEAVSGEGNTKKLIDQNGMIKAEYTPAGLIKIVKSGFRNILTASTTNLVSLESPFTTDHHLKLISNGDLTAMKVINASATTFDESWGIKPVCNPITVNQSYVFSMRPGDQSSSYCDSGAIIKPDSISLPVINKSCAWQTSLARSGLWLNQDSELDLFKWMGFEACIKIDTAKTYFFGFAADNGIKIYIDGVYADSTHYYQSQSYRFWHVSPHYLTKGNHNIHIEFSNRSGPATAGFEIYNNSAAQLTDTLLTSDKLNMIFTTKSIKYTNVIQSFRDVGGSVIYHYTINGEPLNVCSSNYQQILTINPYLTGYLGNWRPYQTKVFQQSRNYTTAGDMNKAGMELKYAGYVNNFYSYWYFDTSSHVWAANPNGSRWVTANTVTLYDKYGQQLENKDALGRYSAANFDFNGELPAAVASNAMNREIYAASLEDSHFFADTLANTDTCNIREFIQPSNHHTLKQLAVNTISHSGNYSALLPSEGVTLATIIDTLQQKTIPYLALDSKKQYITQATTGLYPNGFEPYPGKKYMFDVWVNDGHPNDKTVRLTLKINGNNVPLTCKAVVEGWKLIEGTMDLSTLGSASAVNVSLVPASGSTVYIDDLRMHPFSAQMKTYAYDDKTMRLMAELDENGFATFYEYDDEGLLVRVKKETERGIMTLKESRSSYRRK